MKGIPCLSLIPIGKNVLISQIKKTCVMEHYNLEQTWSITDIIYEIFKQKFTLHFLRMSPTELGNRDTLHQNAL